MSQEKFDKKKAISIDIPVKILIRITKKPNEIQERAMIILKDENGIEYTLQSNCPAMSQTEDLTICELFK